MNNNFVKYKDLLTINEYNRKTNKEEFVFLPLQDEFVVGNYKEKINMLEYGDKIPVRKAVYQKLINVAKRLKNINDNYKIMVVYGYRDMSKQIEYFNEILEKVEDKFKDKMEMYEYIHEKIAVPNVSGHPTGGAVDCAIYDESQCKLLDFGSEILDYSTNLCYYENENISKQAKDNRKLLRETMLEEGFAPYDGEWWHFSYGDKEWAFYYKKDRALYNQIESIILLSIKTVVSNHIKVFISKNIFNFKFSRR